MDAVRGVSVPDDLSRDVYCVLGMPIDLIDMKSTLQRIEAAAASRTPYLISTPNLNFLVNSRRNPDFRKSLLMSDLCTADGMPILWIARLLGVPIRHRVAGSDMFEALRASNSGKPLKVFLFGGAEGVAEAAARTLNEQRGGIYCVGTLCPGFGSVDAMSSESIVDKINASNADFLVVALGAQKGQSWLWHNHSRCRVPIRAHLGTTINFQAGTVRRAPQVFRKTGLEWLWRIKEEPHLWRRYLHDGLALLRILMSIMCLSGWKWWALRKYRRREFRSFHPAMSGRWVGNRLAVR